MSLRADRETVAHWHKVLHIESLTTVRWEISDSDSKMDGLERTLLPSGNADLAPV